MERQREWSQRTKRETEDGDVDLLLLLLLLLLLGIGVSGSDCEEEAAAGKGASGSREEEEGRWPSSRKRRKRTDKGPFHAGDGGRTASAHGHSEHTTANALLQQRIIWAKFIKALVIYLFTHLGPFSNWIIVGPIGPFKPKFHCLKL